MFTCRRHLKDCYFAVTSLGMLVIFYLFLKQRQLISMTSYSSLKDFADHYKLSMKVFGASDGTTCADLVKGHVSSSSEECVQLAMAELQKHLLPDTAFVHLTQNCTQFANEGGYTNKQVTKEEEDFPLAFGIIMYKSAQQVEQLLRTIYRPHNIYCIHVDSKSSGELHEAMQAISSCFDNVFIASKSERVVWSSVSQINAEMNCHKDALKRNSTWKYFINLTGQEFPLKTNLEIVQILKTFNGHNDISNDGRLFPIRTDYRYREYFDNMKRTRIAKTDPIPQGIRIRKGELHSALTRDFINFLHSEKISKQLLDWVADTKNPDEIYYQTLASLPGAPGGPGLKNVSSHVSRAKIWYKLGLPCHGKYVRNVCVFAWKDLPWLIGRPQLFANKFHIEYDLLVLKCLEEETQRRSQHSIQLDLVLYEKFVGKRSWYGIGRVDRWRTEKS